ncbi:MAG TPA: hypothetical protein PKD79_01115 [Candidatus Doudnabacteria bacterium]|nr:hypothetical protein [Candidatus Doudnabacteria bacterium]
MKNLNINFDLKTIINLIFKRFSLVLWIAIGLVLIAEGFILKNSLDKIITANDASLFANVQLVRVNFFTYDNIEKKLNYNTSFLPEEPVTTNPFGLPPATPQN